MSGLRKHCKTPNYTASDIVTAQLAKYAKFIVFFVLSHFTYSYLEIPVSDLDMEFSRKVYALEDKMLLN